MIATNRLHQTWALLKIALHYTLQHLSLLIFPLVSTLLYLICEIIVLYIIYQRWGIHVFKTETLEYWGLVSFWDFSTVALVTALPIYFVILSSTLFAKFCTAYATLSEFTTHSMNIPTSLVRAWHMGPTLLQYAYISSLLFFIEESVIRRWFKHHIRNLGGRRFVHPVEMERWLEDTYLVIPLFTDHHLSVEQALDQSQAIMQKTFGSYIQANFNFFTLGLWIIIPLGLGSMHIVTQTVNPAAGIALLFAIIGVVMNLLSCFEAIFQSAAYHYCIGKPTGPFEHKIIQESFISEAF